MSSLRRINSSRANPAPSRGRITLDGNEHASSNALRHGLLAECVVLENESNECFDDLVNQHIRRFAPRNQPPGDQMSRLAAAFSQLAASPELSLLHRYEARLHRMYQRALNNVLMLGEPELPEEPSPISEQSAPVLQLPRHVDAHQEVHLPAPDALPEGAHASPQIDSLLREPELPKEPSPISEHQPPGP